MISGQIWIDEQRRKPWLVLRGEGRRGETGAVVVVRVKREEPANVGRRWVPLTRDDFRWREPWLATTGSVVDARKPKQFPHDFFVEQVGWVHAEAVERVDRALAPHWRAGAHQNAGQEIDAPDQP